MLTERSARVAAAVKLHRHVGRRRAGRFLAEGPNLVEAAARRGLVRDVFVTEVAQQCHASLLATLDSARCPVHPVTERAAKALDVRALPWFARDEILGDEPRFGRHPRRDVGVGELGLRAVHRRFEAAVQQIFAVEVLPRLRYPELINDDEAILSHSFVLPQTAAQLVGHKCDLRRKSRANDAQNGGHLLGKK